MDKRAVATDRLSGFSLAELIVSIGILAVFMSFSVVTLGALDRASDPVEAEVAEAADWIRGIIAQANNERREVRFTSLNVIRTRLTASWPDTNQGSSYQASYTAFGVFRTDIYAQSYSVYQADHQTLSPAFELTVYRAEGDRAIMTRWRIKVSVRGLVTCYQE